MNLFAKRRKTDFKLRKYRLFAKYLTDPFSSRFSTLLSHLLSFPFCFSVFNFITVSSTFFGLNSVLTLFQKTSKIDELSTNAFSLFHLLLLISFAIFPSSPYSRSFCLVKNIKIFKCYFKSMLQTL